jgi:hypothetical protein
MVQTLNWNTLEQRRSMADVTLMYKVVHQLVARLVLHTLPLAKLDSDMLFLLP